MLLVVIVALRFWASRRREARIRKRRRVEQPNSYYSAPGVQWQVARHRWAGIDVERLHPVNRQEVTRLLELVLTVGPSALAPRDRAFLDTLAEHGST